MISKVNFVVFIGVDLPWRVSVPRLLQESRLKLADVGVKYVGTIFEYMPNKVAPWQRVGGEVELFSKPESQIKVALSRVVQSSIADCRESGLKTIVWCVDWAFERPGIFSDLLHVIEKNNCDLKVSILLERHDAWAFGQYLRWGLQLRSEAGPLRKFEEWIEGRIPSFSEVISGLLHAFSSRVIVKNVGDIENIPLYVDRMLGISGNILCQQKIKPERFNTDLLFRVLYNERYQQAGASLRYDSAIGPLLSTTHGPNEFLQRLMPSDADMVRVAEIADSDRVAVNEILEKQAQPKLESSKRSSKPVSVDNDRLLFGLAKLTVHQARRIDALESQLREIKKGSKAKEPGTDV